MDNVPSSQEELGDLIKEFKLWLGKEFPQLSKDMSKEQLDLLSYLR